MKKVSLMMVGLTFMFFGLQSFVQSNTSATEKTTLTVADENWQSDKLDADEQDLALSWYLSECTTPEGMPGLKCGNKWSNVRCNKPTTVPECNSNS